MFAIIQSGGRQVKVSPGDVVTVDRVADANPGDEVTIDQVLVLGGLAADQWLEIRPINRTFSDTSSATDKCVFEAPPRTFSGVIEA